MSSPEVKTQFLVTPLTGLLAKAPLRHFHEGSAAAPRVPAPAHCPAAAAPVSPRDKSDGNNTAVEYSEDFDDIDEIEVQSVHSESARRCARFAAWLLSAPHQRTQRQRLCALLLLSLLRPADLYVWYGALLLLSGGGEVVARARPAAHADERLQPRRAQHGHGGERDQRERPQARPPPAPAGTLSLWALDAR